MPFLFAILVCISAVGALSQLDFHVILFVRSLQYQVLEQISNVGNRLGHGLTITLLCGGLFVTGYFWKNASFSRAGIDGLVAQLLVGLSVQVPKRLIGRPRPRFTHQDSFQFGPSFESGLDAFPSGHAAAAFAMAAVLARNFPKGTLVWYGTALFVAFSRVFRGSHFPTDVMMGAILGYLIGNMCAHSLREWRTTFLRVLPEGLPLLVGGFALLWIVFHRSLDGGLEMGLFWAGWLAILVGIGVRWHLRWENWEKRRSEFIGLLEANLLVAVGLALHTQSLLVVGLAFLTGASWWLLRKDSGVGLKPQGLVQEVLFGSGAIGLALGIQQLRGLIPLL